ncbi:hypothetical protein E4U42_002000 [Claviceps africana]|uniref:Uncharacterized protein n=1 Tax=Claviceps africana TaxID=83212 RepID=A0A8K0NHS0_9HYPO|nr:hypothetical protein E4U42_002000 [Claviceps africana]
MSATMAVQAQAKPENSSSSSSATKRGGGGSENIPTLTFRVLTSEPEKQDAMRLVTDSIAQQRQVASFSVIAHPACLTGLVAGCASIYRLHAQRDFGTTLIMMCGLVLAYLAAVRLLTANYIRLAESLKWKQWIAGPGGNDDHILAARFGDEIIGTLVLRIMTPASSAKRATSSSVEGGSGVIRAWTTRYKYRNKGIGGDMLRLAVLTTRSKCGGNAPVTFDPEHANSARPLHDMFNRPFARREERALVALEQAIAACDRGESCFQDK